MNRAAQSLVRLARGVPKNFTLQERARRRQRLAAAWPNQIKNMNKVKIEILKTGELRCHPAWGTEPLRQRKYFKIDVARMCGMKG